MSSVPSSPAGPAYIETAQSSNRIHRKAVLCGAQRIHLEGKVTIHSAVTLRGDLAKVTVGRLTHVGNNTVITPCNKIIKGVVTYFNLALGSNVIIGADCVISAAVIGSHVKIGSNVVIGDRCILKDCCEILPNSTLAADTVVPPMAIMGGVPAVIVGHLPESIQALRDRETRQMFEEFRNA